MSAAPRHLAGLFLAALVLALALQLALAPAPPPVGLRDAAAPWEGPPYPAAHDGSPSAGAVRLPRGFGAVGDYWSVYFSAPPALRRSGDRPPALRRSGDRPPGSYNMADDTGGIDGPLAAAMDAARVSLDIAAFELNNPLLTEAILAAALRGLRVRVVTDDEHGLRADDSRISQLQAAGIPVVADDRSALMHNKFVLIDALSVWSGSMNLTVNGAGRHNNNLLELRSAEAAKRFLAEFDEMFAQGRFGPRSPQGETAPFVAEGLPSQTGRGRIAIYFGPEDDLAAALGDALAGAQESIRFMAFSFTLDDLGAALLKQAAAGVTVQGVFERVGSESVWSELGPLYCAGLTVRQDGNPFLLHHKVILIDDHTVVTGSANFSASGTGSNDENLLVIEDPALAAAYAAEFARRWDEASTPRGLACA